MTEPNQFDGVPKPWLSLYRVTLDRLMEHFDTDTGHPLGHHSGHFLCVAESGLASGSKASQRGAKGGMVEAVVTDVGDERYLAPLSGLGKPFQCDWVDDLRHHHNVTAQFQLRVSLLWRNGKQIDLMPAPAQEQGRLHDAQPRGRPARGNRAIRTPLKGVFGNEGNAHLQVRAGLGDSLEGL
jgi:hypothetical protein